MAIVGTPFLLAECRALARIHVEHGDFRRAATMYLSFHWPRRSARAARFSGWLSHFVSNRPIWPAEAAGPGDRSVAHDPSHRGRQPMAPRATLPQISSPRIAAPIREEQSTQNRQAFFQQPARPAATLSRQYAADIGF
jgi:hypothetical protein